MLIQYRIQFTGDGVTISQFVDPDGSPNNGLAPTQGAAVTAKRLGSSFQDPGGVGNPNTGPGGVGNPNTGPGGSISSTGPIKAILLGPLIITASSGSNIGGGGVGNPNTGPGGVGNPNTGPGGVGNAKPVPAVARRRKA